MDSNAYDDIYEEYIENILSISALSDKDHYIFYNFNIKDNVCYDEVYMLNQEGIKGELGKKNFNYNEDFYEKFLKNLVGRFYKANSINSKDVIFDDNNESTFRMITDKKDIFTISGFIYIMLELAWRGRTHWTMFILDAISATRLQAVTAILPSIVTLLCAL